MYTRCSECQTLYRVTRAQLNAARGQVRCGHCRVTFDALASLREEVTLATDAVDDIPTRFPVSPEAEVQSPMGDDDVEQNVDIESYAELLAPPRVRTRRWPWIVAIVVLLLAVALQLVHVNRERLVEHELVGPFISTAYERIGYPIVRPDPRYDLHAFVLLHHELVLHPQDESALHLSGVLYNSADFAQPWPTLELRLEDRFGDVVAARRLEPDEYLRNAESRDALMPADARRAIEIVFIDPGEDAVGFAIEFCLMLRDGLRCAGRNDLP
jgi:predicted Zn finger-like uncharacterized protein